MAIPKKNSRKIVVDGQAYRWVCNVRCMTDDVTITVQNEAGDGALLQVYVFTIDPFLRELPGWLRRPTPPNEIDVVTPAFVRSAILYAQSIGWEPITPGKTLVLRYKDEAFHRE